MKTGFNIITVCTFLYVESSMAHSYTFDSSLLNGSAKGVNLSLFEKGSQLPGIYHVDIILNGSRIDSRDVFFYTEKDSDGQPYLKACLSREILSEYGVKTDDYPGLFYSLESKNHIDISSRMNDKSECANLSIIPQAMEKYLFNRQQLLLSIPQVALRPPLQGIAPERLWDDGIPALLFNWQANTTHTQYRNIDKINSDSSWLSLEPGANLGPWRFRNLTTWNKSSGHQGNWDSVYTRVERGINRIKSRFILGEDYTQADIFDSVPFLGLSLGSDDSMVPYNVREFAPVIRGIANSQARVEVRQNGYILQSQTVAPGAFALTNLPTTGSSGDLQVTVRESDGVVQRFTVPYSTPAIGLRQGYMKYSIAAGQYRPADGGRTHSTLGQFTTIYGLPWGLTAFGGMQMAKYYQASDLGFGLSLGSMGAISADSLYMQSQPNGQNRETGNRWNLRYNKSFEQSGTNLTIARYQYSSEGYHTLSDILDSYRQGKLHNVVLRDNRSSRTTLNLSQDLGTLGYITIHGSRDEYHNSKQKQDYLGVTYSSTWKNISWSVNWLRSHKVGRYYGDTGNIDNSINLWMTVPFGNWWGSANSDISSTVQMHHASGQKIQYEVGLGGRIFDRRMSWNARKQMVADSKAGTGSSLINMRWYGTYGELAGMYSYSNYMRQMSAEINGGMVVHGEGITIGQRTGTTVALVTAPGVEGVSIGGWPGVRTDFRGYALVGHISPYQENIVTLNPTTLPPDSEVLQTDTRVIPTKGAVIKAKFNTLVGGRTLMTLLRQDGSPLPFGSIVTVEGSKKKNSSVGIVGEKGEVYLSGLSKQGRMKAVWGENSQCYADYSLPEKSGPAGIFLSSTVCM
ncbi:fimbria/pilus outer membrane usher protein [Escherichia coli]|nr:fimbria/pilus outer membrane usher protein [Escherichia coli]